MILTPEDIEAIAAAVVRQMRVEQELRLDAQYEASLPVEEQKKRARAKMREQDRQKRAAKKKEAERETK